MNIKVIKTQSEYEEAVDMIKKLMDHDIAPNSVDMEKLDLLVTLVQDYESRLFPDNIPDPIDAILFRMDQLGLSQTDLVTYIGSKSKVSEILARKRPLSLNMIKSLHDGLGIPAKVLLNQIRVQEEDLDYERFPVAEMLKRGYIAGKDTLEKEMKIFFNPMVVNKSISMLLSRTYYIRSPRPMNQHALLVWMTRVVTKSQRSKLSRSFHKGDLTIEVLKEIVKMTSQEDSINKIRERLNSLGIALIIEPHMPQTYLDGAAIMTDPKNPIVGMTLRHDRFDNFWFTLLHELAHIYLHFGTDTKLFYDDIEFMDSSDPREKEADELALNIMVPEDKWKYSPASIVPSPDAARLLAGELGVDASIIAGKIRYSRKRYHLLNNLIGQGEVRKLFPEISWKK